MNDSEKILLVDLDDQVIGSGTKTDVHRQGILHRAFSVFVVNGNKMLLQKRVATKYHSGGLWSNACCSHQRKGETLDDAVRRRMLEELGFDCELSEQFSFTYRTVFENGLIEYELDHVFVGEYCGEIRINHEEASDMRWVEFGELKKELLNSPEQFSSWFMIAAPKIMRILEGK